MGSPKVVFQNRRVKGRSKYVHGFPSWKDGSLWGYLLCKEGCGDRLRFWKNDSHKEGVPKQIGLDSLILLISKDIFIS